MEKITRDDIQTIAQNSNWTEKSASKWLHKSVYSDRKSWINFLNLLFIGLGVSLFVAGVLFFFAFNWASLHKFIKIGLIEGLIIAAIAYVYFSKSAEIIKNSVLTGAAMLVGVLFAVFGQVYQTGANAYDFFLGWTMAVFVWSLVGNFAALWLLFIVLVNTTLVLYAVQISGKWMTTNLISILFVLNAGICIGFHVLKQFTTKVAIPKWFLITLSLATVSLGTSSVIMTIFSRYNHQYSIWLSLLPVFLVFSLALYYAWKVKEIYLLAILILSLIVIISSKILEISTDSGSFFSVGIFVILAISGTVVGLNSLIKNSKNEE
jgi:uncharacterized membrane protein